MYNPSWKMSDNDLSEIPNEDNYDFDYYALSKLKDREQKKLIVLGIIIGVLCVITITFITLYHRCETHHDNNTTFKDKLTGMF